MTTPFNPALPSTVRVAERVTERKADANTQFETNKANKTAIEKSSAASKDATEEKREAEYKVAEEKCDDLTGVAKDGCVNRAKSSFGKL